MFRVGASGGGGLIGAAVAVVVGGAVALLVSAGAHAVAGEAEPADLVTMTPCRLVDTRPESAVGERLSPLGPAETMSLEVTGDECGLPEAASGAVLNVTPVNASEPTFLTVWGDGERPWASALNPNPALPPVPNAVTTDLTDDGEFFVYNRFGSVDIVVDVTGYYLPDAPSSVVIDGSEVDLQAVLERLESLETQVASQAAVIDIQTTRIDDLEAVNAKQTDRIIDTENVNAEQTDRIVVLENLLAGVSRAHDSDGYDTLTFSAMNLQVVNGTNKTYDTANGVGNLYIGYNVDTDDDDDDDVRAGSHNLVIGDDHTHTAGAQGGLVSGNNNTIAAFATSVVGGVDNEASGDRSTVAGGVGNTASGSGASIGGGFLNTASGTGSTVTGGYGNYAEGGRATISGGYTNQAPGYVATVAGGNNNTASGDRATAAGGNNNTASSTYATTAGGDYLTCGTDNSNAILCMDLVNHSD